MKQWLTDKNSLYNVCISLWSLPCPPVCGVQLRTYICLHMFCVIRTLKINHTNVHIHIEYVCRLLKDE